jgi:hypothetical protein
LNLPENKEVKPSLIHGPSVVNFLSRTLTEQENLVLEKGPYLCFKSNKVPVEEIMSSVETSLHRNIRQIKDVSLVGAFTVKNLSNFIMKPETCNKSLRDIRILNGLKKDELITITKVDKRNTLVVMDA